MRQLAARSIRGDKRMKKNKMTGIKKGLLLTLCVLLLGFAGVPVQAGTISYLPQAKVLQELGLFTGTENGYELERSSTRAEAAVMLVRVLGQEKNIQKSENCPFQDVEPWAIPYINLLYEQKIAFGISEDYFGAADPITPAQYMTYLLRILGYLDTEGDFDWENALGEAQDLGIIQAGDLTSLTKTDELSRGGMVNLTYHTLFAGFKEEQEITLLEKLYLNDGAVSQGQLQTVSAYNSKVAEVCKKLGITPSQSSLLSTQEIARRVSPAVFYLLTYDADNLPLQSGSGFFIESDGVAVTNYHVLEHAYQAQIQSPDGQTYDVEGVLCYDTKLDLALLKVKGQGFPVVEIGDSDALETGEKVYSISSPLGLSNTFSEGIISNVRRWMEDVPYIQMTVPISSGSSGGVLLNGKAQAVGIITAIVQDGQSLNFALPVKLLQKLPERNLRTLAELHPQQATSAQIEKQDGLYYEEENNNFWTLANFLNGPTTVAGILDYWNNDMDYFEIQTIMPGKVMLSLLVASDMPNSLALALVQMNEEGNAEGIAFADYVKTEDGHCEYQLQYDLNEPGVYYLVVYPYKKEGQQQGDLENYILDYQFTAQTIAVAQ